MILSKVQPGEKIHIEIIFYEVNTYISYITIPLKEERNAEEHIG